MAAARCLEGFRDRVTMAAELAPAKSRRTERTMLACFPIAHDSEQHGGFETPVRGIDGRSPPIGQARQKTSCGVYRIAVGADGTDRVVASSPPAGQHGRPKDCRQSGLGGPQLALA